MVYPGIRISLSNESVRTNVIDSLQRRSHVTQTECSGCESESGLKIPIYICQGIPLADMACRGNSENAGQLSYIWPPRRIIPALRSPRSSYHAQAGEEAARDLRTFRGHVPLSRNFRDLPRAAQEEPPARGRHARAAQHRAQGRRALADRPDLGHLLPRRDGALCLPQPGVRAVLAR